MMQEPNSSVDWNRSERRTVLPPKGKAEDQRRSQSSKSPLSRKHWIRSLVCQPAIMERLLVGIPLGSLEHAQDCLWSQGSPGFVHRYVTGGMPGKLLAPAILLTGLRLGLTNRSEILVVWFFFSWSSPADAVPASETGFSGGVMMSRRPRPCGSEHKDGLPWETESAIFLSNQRSGSGRCSYLAGALVWGCVHEVSAHLIG
jgi:hypothetical protein